jgi:hypothetical protein
MQYPELYFDADDVERGYYVYAHKCRKTNQIFYVGKGKEGRAWNDRRSRAWKEHVEKLEQGFDVLLLHDDLTEEEAIDLERVEIDAQGGPASAGGRLINWIPGEFGQGFGVAFGFQLGGGDEPDEETRRLNEECRIAYRCARRFKALTKQQKDELAMQFDHIVRPATQPIEMLWEEYCAARRDAEFPDVLESSRSKCYWISDLAHQISRRKISYIQFCEQVDDQVEQLESTIREAIKESQSSDHITLCQRAYDAVTVWCALFADGTRDEAQSASDRVWIRHRFPPGERFDEDFAKYVALTRAFFGDKQADDRLSIRAEMIREVDRRLEAPPPA